MAETERGELFEWEVMEYVYHGPSERHKPSRKRQSENFKRQGDRFWATEAEVEPEKWKVKKVPRQAREVTPPPPPRRGPGRPRKMPMEDTMLRRPPQTTGGD